MFDGVINDRWSKIGCFLSQPLSEKRYSSNTRSFLLHAAPSPVGGFFRWFGKSFLISEIDS
jgi:hypothetical protein